MSNVIARTVADEIVNHIKAIHSYVLSCTPVTDVDPRHFFFSSFL